MAMQQNFEHVEQRIQAACDRSGRQRDDIQVIAVTKYATLEQTEQVLDLGCEHIGESRWQDARDKWASLGHRGHWHFIGHLQTNKVRDVIGKFTTIHSLDRMSLAKELNKRATALDIEVDCFIQVNVSGEATKYGCKPEELFSFAERLASFPKLRIKGLMTMAPYEASEQEIRHVFRTLRQLRDEVNERKLFAYDLNELSMGMSNDFEIAIEEGATAIRLGSILMGA